MFGIGGFELILIILFVLVVFGPDKLPELGRTFGKGLRMFNKAKDQVQNVVQTEILRPEDMELFRDPLGMKNRKIPNPLLTAPAGASVAPKSKKNVTGSEASAESVWAAAALDEAEEESEE